MAFLVPRTVRPPSGAQCALLGRQLRLPALSSPSALKRAPIVVGGKKQLCGPPHKNRVLN
jgi:hypothetical protein